MLPSKLSLIFYSRVSFKFRKDLKIYSIFFLFILFVQFGVGVAKQSHPHKKKTFLFKAAEFRIQNEFSKILYSKLPAFDL